MRSKIESVIRRIGTVQHGVVTRLQLEQAGVAAHLIDYRVKRGRLVGLYRNVYRTGATPARYEPEMAGVLACGDGAVLSHRSAAVFWDLTAAVPAAPVDISMPSCSGRKPGTGVRVHRVRTLHTDEVTVLHGIAITTAPRTLLDLATSVDTNELERCIARACSSRLATHEQIEQLVLRHRVQPGIRILRLMLARGAEPMLTRSEAEKLALTLFRKAGLEPPESNVILERYEVDFLWRRQHVAVEIDGFAFHSSAADFERDRLRDATLMAAGYRVVRVTWRQLTRERESLIARLAAALARSS